MRVLVSGSSGLVGKALCTALEKAGHAVVQLVRNDTALSEQAIYWDPDQGVLAGEQLAGLDAVVHLAGEPIATGRWSAEKKARIRDSRVKGTQLLADRLASLEGPPPVLISASAIGYYGNQGDAEVTEEAPLGHGFLAEVCRDWEAATKPAAEAGIRVVNLRIGVVLSSEGGALAKMLPPFRMGMGGPLGNGKMWMSWIHLDDLVGAILHALETEALRGPVNGFAPNPVTNKEFARTLGRVLKRPAVLPVPATVLRTALGDMADELLLSSVRGVPARLQDTGFAFAHPELEGALRDLLGKSEARAG